MSEKPISPLRQRMVDDMNMRRFVPDTQRAYIRAVRKLAAFLGRSPDTTTPEELRAFQLHLAETSLQPQRDKKGNGKKGNGDHVYRATLHLRSCSAETWSVPYSSPYSSRMSAR
jgi:Phage integrase, N-terminal SAM-like domain